MVRTRQYKIVYNPIDFDELYDLAADPWEMHNLAADPHMQAIKEQMLVRMWRHDFQSENSLINDYAPIARADLCPAVLNR